MAGQNNWQSQGTGVNDYIVQALIDKKMYNDVRDADAFGSMELIDPDQPNPNGLRAVEGVDAGGTGAILTQELSKTEEARFSLRENLRGEASYGDTQPGSGDTFSYLHQNFFINEVDSKWIPIMGRQSQRRVAGMILDHKGQVMQGIKDWHIEERSNDIHHSLFMGADLGQMGDPNTVQGALGKTLGAGTDALAVGVDAPIEHLYTPIAGATKVVIPSAGPRSNAYRTNVITALAALSAANNKYATRDTLAAIAEFAVDNKIMKVKGSDWDYELVVDPAIVTDLMQSDSDLVSLFKTAQQGQGIAGQVSLDTRRPIVVDGLRVIPDAGMKKWRVLGNGVNTGVNAGTPVLTYGDGSRDRREKTFVGDDYRIGWMVLLGAGCLLQGTDGLLETIQAEDEAQKGWKAYGRINRSFRRSLWLAKDGRNPTATDGWKQRSCMAVAMNIRAVASLT